MTRFARVVGSNTSNSKIPDEATPWNDLKNPLEAKVKQNNFKNKSARKITWKQNLSDDTVEETDAPAGKPSKKQKAQDAGTEPDTSNGGKSFKRRKPLDAIPPFYKNGEKIEVVRFEGFPVRASDLDRLKALKKELLASKIPHHEIKMRMKLERRRSEKALSREKKKVCFHCRNSGHMLSECPMLSESALPESGICFKCGSTEHQHMQCKSIRGDDYRYATCFICNEQGHVSKQCPDNPRGLYPQGGACRTCGDVTHLQKDCTLKSKKKKKKEEIEVTVEMMDSRKLDALDEELKVAAPVNKKVKKRKVIKM